MAHLSWNHKGALVLPWTTAIVLYHPTTRRAVRCVARIDTGSNTTGIPAAVAKQLGLKQNGSKRIVDGNGVSASRATVRVGVRATHGLDAIVVASVRTGTKLGRTCIVSLDMLRAASRPVLVLVPSVASIHFDHPSCTRSLSVGELDSMDTARSASAAESAARGSSTMHRECARTIAHAVRVPVQLPVELANARTGAELRVHAKIDTGAALSAVPLSLMRKLALPSLGQVNVRSSHDVSASRPVVLVKLTLGGLTREIVASVRRQSIVLIGRQALQQFPVLVDTRAVEG